MDKIKELKSASEMHIISSINEDDDYDYKELREYFIEIIESVAAKGYTWVMLNCYNFKWIRLNETCERKLPEMFSRFLDELVEKGYEVSAKELEAKVSW